jgi:hypothetical protein
MAMRTLLASVAVLVVIVVPARADRPVTDAERTRLVTAVAAQGCSGGKMEWDEGDREFEVDDARCDGRKYDLKFHADYSLKSKKLDD